MTELIFQYSGIYDRMLAKLAGEQFDDKYLQRGRDFEKKIRIEWQKYNNKVFKYYKDLGFQLPNFWLAYAVHSWKDITPFSSPLTIIIHDGLDKIISTVIHELCHVFFSYYENKKVSTKLWQYIIKKFPKENSCTQEHLIVIPLARSGVYHVFGKNRGEALLSGEKNFTELRRAWEILDIQKELHGDPIKAILCLENIKS